VKSRVSLRHQQTPALEDGVADLGRLRWGIRYPLTTEVFGYLAEIVVVLQFRKIGHQRIVAPALAKIEELVEKVACWLAGDAWIVALSRCAALLAVTGDARLHALID
jgi:hypothetical protein